MEEQFDRRLAAAASDAPLTVTHLMRRKTAAGEEALAGGAEYRLLFLQRGNAVCGGTEWSGGACLFLKPGQTVKCVYSAGGVLCGFGFRGEDAERLYALICRAVAVPVVIHRAPDRLSQLLEAAASQPEGAAGDACRAGLLYVLLSGLIAEDAAQPDDVPYGKAAMIYMRENYTRPISVGDVAKAVGVSRSWLYRCFMDYTAQSPAAYLRALRMERAKSLLRRTSLSVQEVAYAVGYEDALYFSRVFSDYTGSSPTQFRNRTL